MRYITGRSLGVLGRRPRRAAGSPGGRYRRRGGSAVGAEEGSGIEVGGFRGGGGRGGGGGQRPPWRQVQRRRPTRSVDIFVGMWKRGVCSLQSFIRAKPFYFIKIKVNNKEGVGIEVSTDNRRRCSDPPTLGKTTVSSESHDNGRLRGVPCLETPETVERCIWNGV
jgi:hypothetical protein